jgi:hypothetical protein
MRRLSEQMSKYCVLCKHTKAEDSIEVECGNNAENSVNLWLCEAHLKEADDDYSAFSDKYGEKIESEWMESMCCRADMLKDDGL